MKTNHDAKERLLRARRKVMRKAVGSRRYLFVLLSLLPPSLTFTKQGAELLGSYQIPVGLILFLPFAVLAVRFDKNQERNLKTRLREQAVCPKCFYDLTGNESGVCPECGTGV